MNYNLLRNYIRYLLIESPLGHSEFKDLEKQFLKYRSDHKELQTSRYDWPKQGKDLRRKAKQIWYNHADHSFWDDPNNITIIHALDWEGQHRGKIANKVIEYFKKYYSVNKENGDELSCFARLGPTRIEDASFYSGHVLRQKEAYGKDRFRSSCLIIGKRKVTYASGVDAFTEDLRYATPKQIKKFKSSGLPKRPSQLSMPLFTVEDVKNAMSTERFKMDPKTFAYLQDQFDWPDQFPLYGIEEVIVDNWLPAFLVLDEKVEAKEVEKIRKEIPELEIVHLAQGKTYGQ